MILSNIARATIFNFLKLSRNNTLVLLCHKQFCVLNFIINSAMSNSANKDKQSSQNHNLRLAERENTHVRHDDPGSSNSVNHPMHQYEWLQGRMYSSNLHQESISPIQANAFQVQPYFNPNLYLDYIQQIALQMPAWSVYSNVNAQNLFGMNFHSMQPVGPTSITSETYGQPRANKIWQYRSWQNMSTNVNNMEGLNISVMSYNVLAQDLVDIHPHLYSSHDQQSLKWQVRWQNLLKEIKKFSPDILCLQEVQESHLEEYYETLNKLGYGNIYKKRTGYRTDGCAIYYKLKKFNLVEHTSIEYYQENTFILNRDNVALIAKFAPKSKPSAEFLVATTHLLYNPKRQDVRLAQIQFLLTELDRMAYNSNGFKKSSPYLPVIMTGDLNSEPESPIVNFLKNGKLKYEHLSPKELMPTDGITTGKTLIPSHLRITDKCVHAVLLEVRKNNKKLSRTEELQLINNKNPENKSNASRHENLFESGTISHNFPLKSVYKHQANHSNEGTTFQHKWITVDYIFYSGTKRDNSFQEDKLKLLARYRLPTETELNGITIPNSSVGSDHLSLLAKFFLRY